MGKTNANIELYSPGIVVFDPEILCSFLKRNGIFSTNLFECFLSDERLGRSVIEEGVILPIYEIPEDEYSVFVDCVESSVSLDVGAQFEYCNMPLQVSSGYVVVSDLNALLDWDADFFKSYKKNYDQKLMSNDYLDVSSGLYSVTLSGYSGLAEPLKHLGYGLKLISVNKLPIVDSDAAVDDRSFCLEF